MSRKSIVFGCSDGELQLYAAKLKIIPWIRRRISGLKGVTPVFRIEDFRLKQLSWGIIRYISSRPPGDGTRKLNLSTMQLMGFSVDKGLITQGNAVWVIECTTHSLGYSELQMVNQEEVWETLKSFYKTPVELGQLKLEEYYKTITDLQTRSTQLKASLPDSKDTSRLQTLREELKYFKRMMPFVKPKDTAFVKKKIDGLEEQIRGLDKRLSQEGEVRLVTENALSTIRNRIAEIERTRDSLAAYIRVLKIKELAGELPEVDDSVVSMFGAATDSAISDASINSRWTKYEED